MKRDIIVGLITLIINFNSSGQINNIDRDIKNKDFVVFLDKFYTIDTFPFNRRKNEEYLIINRLYKGPGISKEESKRFLNKTENDLTIQIISINEDGKIISSNFQEKYVYKGQKIFLSKYILLITEESPDKLSIEGSESYDTLRYYLRIFDYDNSIVDSIVVGGYDVINKEYKDVVFITRNKFRIFQYHFNEKNISKGYIVDKTKPLTFLDTIDYEIDEKSGKIKYLSKSRESIALYRFVQKYQKNGNLDDPMDKF